jgi:hypothetical protein
MIPVIAARARRTLVIALSTTAAVLATGGCDSAEPELRGQIDTDTYVTVMSELADVQRFPPPGSDEATRSELADSVRRGILERHGVTVDELLGFAEAVGARPDLMVDITDRIVATSDSLARNRTGAGRAADSVDTGLGPGLETAPDSGAGLEFDSAAADSTPAVGRDTALRPRRIDELLRRRGAGRVPSP